MNELVQKLVTLEMDLSTERGGFLLFGLFLREDSVDLWDLVISALWLEPHGKRSLEFIAEELKSRLETHELVSISRIVLLEPSNSGMKAIHQAVSIEHGEAKFQDTDFFGMQMRHAYIFTSKRESTPVAARAG